MNYQRLTASFIAIAQLVSVEKELIGASMTIDEILSGHMNESDFEISVGCFEATNKVVLDLPGDVEAVLSMTVAQVIAEYTKEHHAELDSLFVTKRFLGLREVFEEALLDKLRRDTEE